MDLYCDFPGCGRWACREHIGWARERADAAMERANLEANRIVEHDDAALREYLRANALSPDEIEANRRSVSGETRCHCGALMMVTPLGGFPSCSAMYKSGYHRDKAE